ncbi:hypothetical protein [Flavobacterium pedocola]
MKKILLLATLGLLFSCSNDDSGSSETTAKDEIILGGFYGNQASYWINNDAITPFGSNSKLNDIVWHNNKLAGCGERYNDLNAANEGTYFQNATADGIQPYMLSATSNTESSYGKAIFSDGTNYYVGGNDGNRITFWKNGYLKTNLTDNSTVGYGNGIYVSGNKLYMVGWQGDTPKAMLWEYNLETTEPVTRTNLSGVRSGKANSIYVVGTDVYVAGWDNYNAVYWKNGVSTALTSLSGADGFDKKAYVNKILVVNNVVYAVGLIKETAASHFTACIWKDGVLTKLTDGTRDSEAYDIKVKGTDVYVVGDESGPRSMIGKVWKNGVVTNYEEEGTNISFRSLIVK